MLTSICGIGGRWTMERLDIWWKNNSYLLCTPVMCIISWFKISLTWYYPMFTVVASRVGCRIAISSLFHANLFLWHTIKATFGGNLKCQHISNRTLFFSVQWLRIIPSTNSLYNQLLKPFTLLCHSSGHH